MNRLILFPLLFLPLVACDDKAPSDDTAASGDLNLSPGFGTASVTGTAGGPVDDAVCEGSYPTEPQHIMTLSASMVGLGVALDGDDLAIMITFESSTFCSDIDTGVSAINRGSWSAGDYAIYVGVPEGGSAREYTLTATEG